MDAATLIPVVLQVGLGGEPRWERKRRQAKLRAEIERLRAEGKLEQALDEAVEHPLALHGQRGTR